MKKIINALLIVDIGIIIFSILSGNRDWFINSQIGFITSSFVMFASIVSYRNMVKARLNSNLIVENDDRDTIEKIEDPHDLYSEDKTKEELKSMEDIVKEEKQKLRKNRRSIWQVTKDSRPALSFYRLGAYGLLILGFFYLNNNQQLDITSYLFSLIMPPIIVITILMREK